MEKAHLLTCLSMANRLSPSLLVQTTLLLHKEPHFYRAKVPVVFLWSVPLTKPWSMKQKWVGRGPETLLALHSTPRHFL